MTVTLADRLSHVRWLGGGSGAGKSTVARRLAARHGLHLYGTDEVMDDHARRTTAHDAPLLHRFAAMNMDERWVDRPPETMRGTFHWYRGEGFELIVEDLLGLPAEVPVLVEGFRLLPERVAPLLAGGGRGVWLLPTPSFRRAAFARRDALGGITERTSDPEQARANLLDRDRLFTDDLRRDTEALGLPTVDVDGIVGEDDLVDVVGRMLGL